MRFHEHSRVTKPGQRKEEWGQILTYGNTIDLFLQNLSDDWTDADRDRPYTLRCP